MSDYTGTVARGAASEMIAAAHLMSEGYHVFRAQAASCPVDLIAWREDEILKVEVKTSCAGATPTHNQMFPRPTNDEWDLLVVVDERGNVVKLRPAATVTELRDAYLDALEAFGIMRRFSAPATHCKRGHEFTEENTARTRAGFRSCISCRVLAYEAAKKPPLPASQHQTEVPYPGRAQDGSEGTA